jgi:hypothetical protein
MKAKEKVTKVLENDKKFLQEIKETPEQWEWCNYSKSEYLEMLIMRMEWILEEEFIE